MAYYLQISLQVNTNQGPKPDINLTPVDVKMPEEVASVMQTWIILADLTDAAPESGKYEIAFTLEIPVIRMFRKTFRMRFPALAVIAVVSK